MVRFSAVDSLENVTFSKCPDCMADNIEVIPVDDDVK
jgi:hypothetical protein